MLYIGVVENRMDPLKIGRCKVRVMGLHTEDKTVLPTDELPWAVPLGSIYSASISGIGRSPTGIVQGSTVLVGFLDGDACQQPVMMGTLYGIPQTQSASFINDMTNGIVTTDESGELVDTDGNSVTDIVDSLINSSENNTSTVQNTGSKYQVVATPIPNSTSVSYNVQSLDGNSIATGIYNEVTQRYEVQLSKPENYTEQQYAPFMDNYPKTFGSVQEITTYFDQNF